MVTIILFTIMIGVLIAIMDKLQFHYGESIFPKDSTFWNPQLSWRNKYKNGNPDEGPKFFGSTTFLVWLTDGWHLVKTIMLYFIFVPFAMQFTKGWKVLGMAIFFHLIYAAGFYLMYKWILVKK